MNEQDLIDAAVGIFEAFEGKALGTILVVAQADALHPKGRINYTALCTFPSGECIQHADRHLGIAASRIRAQAPQRAAKLAKLASVHRVSLVDELRKRAHELGFDLIATH